MKRILIILFLSLLLCVPGEARERVAVLDFSGNARAEYLTAAFNRLTNRLADLDRFIVIERSEVERLLEEQHFQWTGLVDTETATKAGKILGAELAFIGYLDRLSGNWRDGYYHAEAKITVKVIHIMTGALVHLIEITGNGSNKNSTTSMHRAIEDSLGSKFTYELRRRFAISSYITRIDGSLVYIEGGQDIGIKPTYRYYIMRYDDYTDSFDDYFTTKVGLLEISEVVSNRSRGKVLYSLHPIAEGDLLVEAPMTSRKMRGLRLKTQNYSLIDREGVIPLIEVLFSTERPFTYSGGYTIGVSYGVRDFSLLTIGLERGLEYPLLGGRIYLGVMGGVGYMSASQPITGMTDSAIDGAFYVNGDLGFKYYLNYEEGSCIKVGINGFYSSALNSWTQDGKNVNRFMDNPNIQLAGIGLLLTVTIPLDSLNIPSLPFFR